MEIDLAACAGKFLLSLNDHPEVRRIFAASAMVQVDVTYSVGGGDKLQQAQEVVINNVPQARLEQLLQ